MNVHCMSALWACFSFRHEVVWHIKTKAGVLVMRLCFPTQCHASLYCVEQQSWLNVPSLLWYCCDTLLLGRLSVLLTFWRAPVCIGTYRSSVHILSAENNVFTIYVLCILTKTIVRTYMCTFVCSVWLCMVKVLFLKVITTGCLGSTYVLCRMKSMGGKECAPCLCFTWSPAVGSPAQTHSYIEV
jgi:hypothetical protein